MLKLKIKNPKTAQGMVEFALVLPIFLLVILALFAVGHYLFTYSFVLSASREAARYGAASGLNENGVYRFQDCDGILAAASRVGGVAGVNNANVTISYDQGPGTSSLGNCPAGGTGPGLSLGDRVEVEINMPYKPIVPLLSFPEINVRSTNARTIVRDINVGKSPKQELDCEDSVTTLTHKAQVNPKAVVGELIVFLPKVFDAAMVPVPSGLDPNNVTFKEILYEKQVVDGVLVDVKVGEADICFEYNPDGTCLTPCEAYAPSGSCNARIFQAGTHSINGYYHGGADPGDPNFCYKTSTSFDYLVDVLPAKTSLAVSLNPSDRIDQGDKLTVSFAVNAVSPGSGTPTGEVHVSGGGAYCVANLSGGIGTCDIYPNSPNSGNNSVTITVSYLGDGNYQPVINDSAKITVRTTIVPTIIVPTPTPSKICPVFASGGDTINFDSRGRLDELVFSITNKDPVLNLFLTSVNLTWPTNPLAKLQEIRFAPDTTPDCKGQVNTCLYDNNGGVNPPQAYLNNGDGKWNSSRSLINANETRQVRMLFSSSLPTGSYKVDLTFSNLCTLSISGTR